MLETGFGAGDGRRFEDLLLSLHGCLASDSPWTGFLGHLCAALDACSATLVLRPPTLGDRGELFDVNTVRPLVDVYRSRSFDDDPFADLGEGVAATMFELIDAGVLGETRYYRELLAPDHIEDMLGINVAFGDRHIGLFRIARRGGARFGLLECSLMARLYPHLRCALTAYDRSRRQRIENRAYIRALDQLALGVVILDDRGEVVQLNETASLLAAQGAFDVVDGRLRLGPEREDAALATIVETHLVASGGDPDQPGWLRLTGPDGETRAHLLLKPIREEGDGRGRPLGVAIFIATTDRVASVTPAACAMMFGLSRAEAALLLELLGGGSILSASQSLGISESTARTQLRSVFVKTGTHRQTDLVRLVLTSLATIA